MDFDTRVLLSNGYEMPLIGLGTCLITEREAVETTLEAAIDAGYRMIDTAFGYFNQQFVGDVLKKIIESGKVKREELFIVDKLPNNGMRKEEVENFYLKSAAELGLDYIDLYIIHSPIATKLSNNEGEIFPFKDGVVETEHVDLVETWRGMESLVKKGLVRSIGLSNFNSEQIKRICENAAIRPCNLQVECHVYLAQLELKKLCKSLNITMSANCPLGTPNFPKQAEEQMGLDYSNAPKLMEDNNIKNMAVKYNRTPAQILLRYLLQREIIPIPKSVVPEQIREYFQIFDFTLNDTDMDFLKSLDIGYRYVKLDFWPGMKEHPEYPFHIPY